MVELVAIYAVQKEKEEKPKKKKPRLFLCLEIFIDLLKKFEVLNVVFQKDELLNHRVMDNSRPRVIDPVNPYNNLAKNWSSSSKKQIMECANETYRRIQKTYASGVIDCDALFDLQGFPRAPVSLNMDKVKLSGFMIWAHLCGCQI